MACNVQGSPGTCTFVPAGGAPHDATECPASRRRRRAGSTARATAAAAAAATSRERCARRARARTRRWVGVDVCDGEGRCKAGPATICAPFDCDHGDTTPASSPAESRPTASPASLRQRQLRPQTAGRHLQQGRATARPASAPTASAATSPATGRASAATCRAAPERAGRSTPGAADPHAICQDKGPPRAGQTGTCDGVGGCSMYAAETICLAPSCSGDAPQHGRHLQRRRHVPPARACRTARPYRCAGGACIARCAADVDCGRPHLPNGSCGPKPNGAPCAAASECCSDFCVDGVCCDGACGGACRSCALPSSMGRCTPSPAGAADPRSVCVDQGAAKLRDNGKCDGAAGCHKYEPGDACAPPRLRGNVYTPPSTCSATRPVRRARRLPCAPFACNGTRCFTACTTDAQCVAGSVCIDNSCGLKLNGASCADTRECSSGNCAQGVCCDDGLRQRVQVVRAADVDGHLHQRARRPARPDRDVPDGGAASCGTQRQVPGGCLPEVLAGNAVQGRDLPRQHDHPDARRPLRRRGDVLDAAATSCFPFRCGAAACKSTCTADADCASPGVCSNGSCGLKFDGAVCGDGTECASGICVQGTAARRRARARACHARCRQRRHLQPVPSGAVDPAGQCRDQARPAAPPTVPATARAVATCTRRARSARSPAARRVRAPRRSRAPATAPARAGPPPASVRALHLQRQQLPGRLRDGQRLRQRHGVQRWLLRTETARPDCAAPAECGSGNCVDGVCCSSASCGTCTSCNVAGSAGACKPVPVGAMEPHGGCTPPRPAGSTAPATAAAHAARWRRAPAAARRRAADRRRRRWAPATALGDARRARSAARPTYAGPARARRRAGRRRIASRATPARATRART